MHQQLLVLMHAHARAQCSMPRFLLMGSYALCKHARKWHVEHSLGHIFLSSTSSAASDGANSTEGHAPLFHAAAGHCIHGLGLLLRQHHLSPKPPPVCLTASVPALLPVQTIKHKCLTGSDCMLGPPFVPHHTLIGFQAQLPSSRQLEFLAY